MNDNIMVTKPNGSVVPLAVRHTATKIMQAKQNWALLGDDVLNITVESPFKQTYDIGDKITAFGRVYKLNRLPKVKKTGMHAFLYDLEFEGIQYDLIRATYDLTIDTTNNQLQDVQADSLIGDLNRFATVLIANSNRVFPGKYVLGTCTETIGDKVLTFGESDNCLSVLQRLCTEFDTEFEIEQENGINTINFKKVGQILPYSFEYGKGKGLYSLDRQNVDSSNIVTRLKVYGASKNITMKYRAQRLCLLGCNKGQSYIEKPDAVAQYGIWEATKYFEDIFPTRTGTVTALGDSVLKFVDTAMFDLNEKEADGVTTKYLLPGVSAKIHFNTGNLTGYEFEVHSYDHSTHTFTLVKQTDERGDTFPRSDSAAFQFSVGDEYKLIDIALPPDFELDAEARLAEAGDTYYDQNSQPKVQYGLSITKEYLKKLVGNENTVNIFVPGDYIPIKDDDIDVDKSVRIKSLTRNLLDEHDYTLTISDTVTTSITNRVISELIDIDNIMTINNLKDPIRARANWRSSREVLNMVFDPEGDYYSDKIKPESIDTIALSVGAKSMQFGLTNTVLQPNYNGNKNVIKVQGGVLTHYTINEETAVSWVLADNTTTFTTPATDNTIDQTPYYIYAKCARVGTAGSIIFSTEQIKVEQDANFYHFWIGIVNSVDFELNARSVALSYGFTMINGRFIKTGRIESADGTTYFDLDNSEIGGRIVFTSNGEEKTLDELGQESLESKDFINNTLPGILSEIQAQLDGQIEQFFDTYDPTTSNAPANAWTNAQDKENHLGDLFYNTDTGSVWRWIKNGTTYSWQQLSDDEVSEALALANEALALARDKSRIFTTTPVTPYEVGDLWVQGASGGIYRCKTNRLTGAYSSSDWELASKYTDDSGLNTFINGAYNNQINNLVTQIDGKIESWFQTSDPAASWTTTTEKAKHVGDMWYNSNTKILQRYQSSYTWIKIEDQTAINAYNAASQAQDTADGKRRVFVATPYAPYDIGDLWVNGTDLRRCATAKASGQSYNVNDWVVAVNYDNTKTVIDGGLVTSGTIQVVGGTTNPPTSVENSLAGITGLGTAANSVRFWAGKSFANRDTAPFRVMQDGSFVATNATITGLINATSGSFTGKITADSGKIGGFTIQGNGLTNTPFTQDNEAYIIFRNDYKNIFSGIGTNVLPATSGIAATARFENRDATGYIGSRNIAAYFAATAGTYNNAIFAAAGDIVAANGYNISNKIITLNPEANTVITPGVGTPSSEFNILAKFTNSNSGIGLPTRDSICQYLGIGTNTPFAVRIIIICSADSTVNGTIWGRNTTVSGMSTTQYAQRLNNNGDVQTGGLAMGKGDIDEYMLVWDGTNYRAYWLGHMN
ncbi:hypothetical protein FACS189426_06790 [Bacteroidia bacterium]|nr:hypothetical protein FACS189426_06790 [Bacteroidia bacterium]